MATDDAHDNRLLALYRRHVGEPDRETDVYLGFALFFGGIALGAIGLSVFLASATLPPDGDLFWKLREVAIALAALGLPAFMLSVAVLLPVQRRAVYIGLAGTAITLLAVGVFVAFYPHHWNVPGADDYSAQGIGIYALGIAVLVAADGTALVAHHLERLSPATRSGRAPAEGEANAGSSSNGETGPTVTREQVEQDIASAVESADLSWGGVEKTETTRRLKIDTGDPGGIDDSGFDPDNATTARSESVDDAVAGLRKLQGGDREEGTGEGTDDQTAALAELREQQREIEALEPDSVVERVRDRFGL